MGTIYKPDFLNLRDTEKGKMMQVRFRTIGDMTFIMRCTFRSKYHLLKLCYIVAASRVTERGTRSDDKRSETAMEEQKKAGYF